jgi:aryl-alcohol dehydrogenase-like predicted oxidoreductase
MTGKKTRRNFLITSVAVAGGLAGSAAWQKSRTNTTLKQPQNITNTASSPTSENLTDTVTPEATIPEQVLGRTGVRVPIFGLGGAGKTPLSRPGEERQAVAILERALELGIRYFDTAPNYGPSEARLGKVLPPHRSTLFLASKTEVRDRDSAWRQLENSLKLLKTDYLDLWQLHGVASIEELNAMLGSSGAIKALEEARQQKLVRFVGITGHHDPKVIAEGLRRYPFHTVLIPVNAADKHHPQPFIPQVLPVAQQKNVGVIAMKVPAYGKLFKPGGLEGMHQAMGYALSQPGVHCCIIAAETVSQLEHNVSVAQAFQPLGEKEMTAIEQRTASIWQDSTFFRSWV